MDNDIQLYRMKELSQMLQRSKTQLYDDIAAGKFPRGRIIGERTRVWTRKEVLEWLDSRPAA